MDSRIQPTGTRSDGPGIPAVPAPPAAAPPASDAVSFLLGRGSRFHRDSRRVAGGLIVLALLGVVMLNMGLYQRAQSHVVRQRWEQLAGQTEARRDQVQNLLGRFANEARYVVGQPQTRAELLALGDGLPAADRSRLEQELGHARELFGFRTIRVLSAQGLPLAGGVSDDEEERSRFAELARQAAGSSESMVLDAWRRADGRKSLVLAVPVRATAAQPPVIAAFEVHAEELLSPVLSRWPGFGPSAGGYLVRKQGQRVQYITAPPAGYQLRAGDRVQETARFAKAAAMAVEGIESSIVLPDHFGNPQAVVTRYLPELGWGFVGQAERVELMQGMSVTLYGLLAFDLALLVLGGSAFWFWRRQYQSGLAQREMEVTRRHAERVQAVFDAAFDAILTFDRTGHVRTVNRAAQSLFGRSAAEMDNQPIHRFLQWGASGRPATELPATGTVVRAEALCADGSVHPVEFALGCSGEGEDLLYSAIVRDITERLESERRIEEFAQGLEVSNRRLEELNAQLEEASRLKSEFLANTSHELRTPLNGMIGFLQLVLDGMCDSPEEEREFQRQALECSRHLLGLINDVLDIAKIEAGKLNLEITPVDLGAVFDEVYTVTHVQAAQRGIRLLFESPQERDVRVRGDFGKIKQILINLVGNSLKFTPKGSVTVRAVPHLDLGHCIVEVVDTGIGIHADRQRIIFEKFTQGDGSTTRRFGGTGLGLAITRSLVEVMGGIIGVQSAGEGRGTRMYFSLPVWNEEEELRPGNEEHGERVEGPAGGQLVLIVEDDQVFRRFLTALLNGHGYRTVEARSAESGWVLARRLRPAVILLDYALTCAESANLRTGWDLAERLTSDSKTRHIPLIFVTGFEGELLEKLKSTAFARQPLHLMKPVEGPDLIARIEELVGSIQGRVVRLLMADDDPAVGAYIRRVLPEDRFHIELAANGDECLHVLRTQPRGFDLLLLDLMMPDVSGYDVLREMTLANLAPDLPVLVLTNFPEPRNDEERRLLEQGLVLDVLPKTSVHENPQLLPHIIDWHLQVTVEAPGAGQDPDLGGECQQEAA
jgi:PAS domain S-box-containing protein